MLQKQRNSIPDWLPDAVEIRIGLPGLVAEQQMAYRKTMHGWLDRLANRIDLSTLGSIEITCNYRKEVKKLGLDVTAKGHVATSYEGFAGSDGEPASGHVILDLIPHMNLLDNTAGRSSSALQSLATALGHATSSCMFKSRYGFSWTGASDTRWDDVTRDCLIAFATSHLICGIGADPSELYFERQETMAEEIKSACSEWSKAETDATVDYAYPALDLSFVYSDFFISTARWLGMKSAKCEASEQDFSHGIGPHRGEWQAHFFATLLCTYRKWIKTEDVTAELVLLSKILSDVAELDLAKRYPPVRDYIANVEPSDSWPAMLVWPT